MRCVKHFLLNLCHRKLLQLFCASHWIMAVFFLESYRASPDYTYLERVQSRIQVGDVHPLAIDVVSINVRTVDRYALVAVVGARECRFRAVRALVVFQTKRRLVALGHFHAAAVQHVERGEHFHAVIMPGGGTHETRIDFPLSVG